jgi:hypothetical protein
MALIVSAAVSPWNARLPEIISCSTAPKANRSLRASAGLPRTWVWPEFGPEMMEWNRCVWQGKQLRAHDFKKCSSFRELWNLVDSCLAPIKGVRELYIYDTALR